MLNLNTMFYDKADDGTGGGAGGGAAGGAPASGDAGAGGAPAAAGGAPAAGTTALGSPDPAAGAAAGGAAGGAAAGGGADDKAYWPADWQDRVSKGDEKRAAVLKRYASPEAVADALIAAQTRIRSGELRPTLPANAKPEEIAAWRKDNGIPETPAGYELKFDNGIVIGEQDKPVIDKFLTSAHEQNMRPEQVKAVVGWYYQEQERIAEEMAQRDEEQRLETLDKLNVEWGKDFRREINMIHGVLARFPDDVRAALEGARLPDGRGLFNHPEVMRGFSAIARELNPAGVLAPSGGGDIAQTLKTEIEQIEKWMSAPRKSPDGKKYWEDDKVQARYRDLLDMRMKMEKQAA